MSAGARRRAAPRPHAAALLALGLLAPLAAGAQEEPGVKDNARWYLGGYGSEILVWDEATEQVVDRIPVRNPIPVALQLGRDRSRLYVRDASFEKLEVVDLAGRRSLAEHTLSSGSTKVRISGFEVDPLERTVVLLAKSYTRHPDRWEVSGPTMLRYDLSARRVTDTIPWPDGEEREGVGFLFSPDGGTLYLLADDVIALDTETFEEVDRWRISVPLEPGLGRLGLPFARGPYDEEEGVFTGLSRFTDPVQNRRMMGIATVRLAERQVDFYTLGPQQPVGFRMAPGGGKAYGLYSEVGRYEVWEFDLEARSVARRVPLDGRPRMALMPSADGRRLFIYNAGNTIDVLDTATLEPLRTIELDVDMTGVAVVPVP